MVGCSIAQSFPLGNYITTVLKLANYFLSYTKCTANISEESFTPLFTTPGKETEIKDTGY